MNDKGLVLLLGTKGGVAGWHLPEGRSMVGMEPPHPRKVPPGDTVPYCKGMLDLGSWGLGGWWREQSSKERSGTLG